MKQIFYEIILNTKGSGLYDFTEQTKSFVNKNNLINGILNINILHTSASLTIQENADSDVLYDLNNFFKKLVPMNNKLYKSRSKYGMNLISMKKTKTSFEEGSQAKAIVFGSDQNPANPKSAHWVTFLNQDTAVLFGAEKYAKKYI